MNVSCIITMAPWARAESGATANEDTTAAHTAANRTLRFTVTIPLPTTTKRHR
jgi:hypothetical protein